MPGPLDGLKDAAKRVIYAKGDPMEEPLLPPSGGSEPSTWWGGFGRGLYDQFARPASSLTGLASLGTLRVPGGDGEALGEGLAHTMENIVPRGVQRAPMSPPIKALLEHLVEPQPFNPVEEAARTFFGERNMSRNVQPHLAPSVPAESGLAIPREVYPQRDPANIEKYTTQQEQLHRGEGTQMTLTQRGTGSKGVPVITDPLQVQKISTLAKGGLTAEDIAAKFPELHPSAVREVIRKAYYSTPPSMARMGELMAKFGGSGK